MIVIEWLNTSMGWRWKTNY